MSFVDLFMNASPLVKGVMLLLLVASLFSWTLIVQRWMFLRRAKQQLEAFSQKFHPGVDLNRLYDFVSGKRDQSEGLEHIFKMGFREFLKLSKKDTMTPDVVMESTERAMRVALAEEEEKLEKHLSFLATIGSLSVYVGLFGTVWGIMTAFQALGTVQQATLSMVAPGISEALIATALGLFASIPASFAYNRYVQRSQTMLRRYDNLADEFFGLLQRQLYFRTSASDREEEII